MNENLKILSARAMAVLGGAVILSVFGTPAGGSRAAIPALIPLFGLPFGILYSVFLLGCCYYFKINKGFWVIAGVWICVTPFYFLGSSLNPDASLTGLARIVTGNACVAALIIGIGIWKEKL